MSESINAEFEAYVKAELGDIAVVSEGRFINPKIQNYFKIWQHQAAKIEALEKDAKRWQAVKPMFRTMSANIDGNHTWTLAYHGSLKGASMDDAADKAIKGEQAP